MSDKKTEAKKTDTQTETITVEDVQAFMEKHDVNVYFYRARKSDGVRVSVNTRKADGKPGVRVASEAAKDATKALSKAMREAKRELSE